ncbi:MAG: nitroreductase family protein [Chloroflexales bacterium]|nr:nitroreductase family protein [Chloroflexales bacterium]
MDLQEAIRARHTTNGAFASRAVAPEHLRQLLEMAARAPSHFNSQPWRFVVVQDAERRRAIGRIAGESMRRLIEEGAFWQQYKRYFRFSQHEANATSDGIHIDNMPAVLRPFVKYLFTEQGGRVMNAMQVPRVLGNDARRLVESSPLLLGMALNRSEYRAGELSGLYSVVSLGAVVQTVWLTATSLGLGLQFVSTPQEVPENWQRVSDILGVPADYELMLLFRLGYTDEAIKRPTIDWTSPQRKPVAELAFQERWGEPLE